MQRVKVVNEGVLDPIVDGVVVTVGIDDEGSISVEVQSSESRKGVAACCEVERELLQDGTLALEQVAVLQG